MENWRVRPGGVLANWAAWRQDASVEEVKNAIEQQELKMLGRAEQSSDSCRAGMSDRRRIKSVG